MMKVKCVTCKYQLEAVLDKMVKRVSLGERLRYKKKGREREGG